MSCDMCTDPDGAPCFPLYGIGPHIHHPGGGTTLLPGAQMAGYTPNLEEPGYGTHWCPHCGDGKPEGAAPTTPILKDLNLELLETATPAGVPAAAPDARGAPDAEQALFLQESDQHLLHRFIETTEDDESYDIGKDGVKRLAELGVISNHGFGRYSVTMFGYWAHEQFWHQNPSLPLKTNADRDHEARAAIAAQAGKGVQ